MASAQPLAAPRLFCGESQVACGLKFAVSASCQVTRPHATTLITIRETNSEAPVAAASEGSLITVCPSLCLIGSSADGGEPRSASHFVWFGRTVLAVWLAGGF